MSSWVRQPRCGRRLVVKAGMAALAGALLAGCSGDSPEDAAKAFTTAICKGETDKALALVYIPEDTRPTEKEAMLGKLRMLIAMGKERADAKGGLERIETIDVETDSNNANRARVKLRLHFKNGQETDDTKLIRVKGKWLVDM